MKKYSIIILTRFCSFVGVIFSIRAFPAISVLAIWSAADAEAAWLVLNTLQQGSYYGGQFPLMSEGLSDNATTGGVLITCRWTRLATNRLHRPTRR
jgi:hypothetical protein